MPLPNAPIPIDPFAAHTNSSGLPTEDFYGYLKSLQRWTSGSASAIETIETDITALQSDVTTIEAEVAALTAGTSSTLLLDTRNAIASATISATVTHVLVAGYATVGDGGQALYRRLSPTPSPVRTCHVQSADGAYWIYAPSDKFNVKSIGAKGDNSQDEAIYFDDIIALANGRKIYAPAGGLGYRFDRPLSSYSGPVNIEGDGNGQATSPGTSYPQQATTFRLNFASGYLFTIDSGAPMVFRDIDFLAVVTPMTGGGALKFGCSIGGLGCSPNVYGCAFSFVYVGITVDKPSGIEVAQRNVFNSCVLAAIYVTTSGGFEGGIGTIFGNIIIGYSAPVTTYGIYAECGYAKINDNYIVGCQTGIELHVTPGAGAFEVFQNQLEEQTTYGVLLANQSGGVAAMPQIKFNEFSNVSQTALTAHIAILDDGAGGDWIDSISIVGNILRSYLDAGKTYILIQSGSYITCDANEITHYGSATAVGIVCSGTAVKAPATVRDNRFGGSVVLAATRYSVGSTVVVRDTSNGTTFANMPAACANGSMFYVSDGKATNIAGGNYALTNGGSGCLSVRCNGAHTVGGVA
jgi:hypothetical protein